MIIDIILDRKDGEPYNAKRFYLDIMGYADIWPDLANPITRAMDGGTNEDVRAALCNYIDECGYNPEIKNWINTQDWV